MALELDSVVCGDCLDVMGEMPDNFVSTVLTDPPYGLSGEPDMAEVLSHWLAGDDYEHRGGGFMGKSWDSFVPGPSVWREVYRVMKPGGTLLAFGGTRTNDLLSIAIRLAGFRKFDEIDYYYGGTLPPQMAWVTGQGFPKSLNISAAIDKVSGAKREWHEVPRNGGGDSSQHINQLKGRKPGVTMKSEPATEAAAQWSGYGTGMKPAHEVILCFYKPRDGSFANNALAWGVAGLWIDGARVATGETIAAHNGTGRGVAMQGNAQENWPVPYHSGDNGKFVNTQGRWPANLILSHVPPHPCPTCDGDGCDACGGSGEVGGCVRRGTRRVRGNGGAYAGHNDDKNGYDGAWGDMEPSLYHRDPDGTEQVDDWLCQPECPCRILGEQTEGTRASKPSATGTGFSGDNALFGLTNDTPVKHNDSGGTAARFFYQAKSSRRERNMGCADVYWRKDKAAPVGFVRVSRDEWERLPEKQRARGNIHPTIKPLGIVEYLCRLTRTPTGGVVFDPFAGTGTTALGAFKTGRHWLCCDNQPDYVYLANMRIEALLRETPQMELAL